MKQSANADMTSFLVILAGTILIGLLLTSFTSTLKCGDPLGSFNGVTAYYNDGFNSCEKDRHMSSDMYSYGMKWQCVEYVRRYYKDVFNHEMNQWGNANDYFRNSLDNGSYNTERGLVQYDNGMRKPKVHDIIVWAGKYGHIAIVTAVDDNYVYIIAQNVGKQCKDRLKLEGNMISPGSNIKGILRL